MTIFEDVKRQYQKGDRVTQLIIINIAVFLVVLLIRLAMMLSGDMTIVNGHEVSPQFDAFLLVFKANADLKFSLTHFWTPFTYMFLHIDMFHILGNMLFVYIFGSILQDMGGRKLVIPIYLFGGLVGWLAFILSAHFLKMMPIGNTAMGASAGVMAIVAASATLVPDYEVNIFFVKIPLRWIASFLIVANIASLSVLDNNNGGHLMHLGGVLAGWFFIFQLQRGRDYAELFDNYLTAATHWLSNLRSPKMTAMRGGGPMQQPKTVFNTPRQSSEDENPDQVVIDAILEKIKRSGIQSLSDEERAWLYKASKK